MPSKHKTHRMNEQNETTNKLLTITINKHLQRVIITININQLLFVTQDFLILCDYAPVCVRS